ncbi:type III PLP-dependent enzyme [Amycolatopsis acidiphila]|uniref:Type III PLP-dependent enzyme n=1 Tax=Amycolatopsis acidiphila TaxID=715473 RepID=A0A558AH97_9PSEU|nr:type III PLP-dependent enzyme [Amycolatopsis acidiphila]TVT23642.1 type III PLP-dependent enzyme [Amycolatopsis acidiphila]UIJ58631.1 type III PLP-dependent enzyme [Amycolatopsis acidiphila]GHG76367.1 diaminopimelate decarboxylase [Amycolatopsis acidiphila]
MTTATQRSELVRRYRTPLYVYDLDKVLAAREDLFESLPSGVEAFYAVKANPHPELIRSLVEGERRCRAEVSSAGELAASSQGGHDPADVLYTGPAKTEDELRFALSSGVRLFSAESVTDLRCIGSSAREAGVVADCLVRINEPVVPGVSGARMTGRPSQFGMDSESFRGAVPTLEGVPGTNVVGFHFFSQSNAESEEALVAEFDHAVAAAARLEKELGRPVRMVDIGGGFACPYGRAGTRHRYPGLRAALEDTLDRHLPRWRSGGVRIAVESGRYLVGECGTLLLGVRSVKTSRGRRFVLLDGGVNTFGGLSGVGRLLPAEVAVEADRVVQRVSLAGPLCTPGDILARGAEVPDLSVGDVIAIPNAGAYGPTASLLAFLSRPAPAEVVVRDGAVVSVSRLEHRRVYENAIGKG